MNNDRNLHLREHSGGKERWRDRGLEMGEVLLLSGQFIEQWLCTMHCQLGFLHGVHLSCVFFELWYLPLIYAQSCLTLWGQTLLSMEFSRQGYWSGLLFPIPGDLPDPEIEPMSLGPPALTGVFFTTSTTWEPPSINIHHCKSINENSGVWASFPNPTKGACGREWENQVMRTTVWFCERP